MKQLLFLTSILFAMLTLGSCNKEEIEPNVETPVEENLYNVEFLVEDGVNQGFNSPNTTILIRKLNNDLCDSLSTDSYSTLNYFYNKVDASESYRVFLYNSLDLNFAMFIGVFRLDTNDQFSIDITGTELIIKGTIEVDEPNKTIRFVVLV